MTRLILKIELQYDEDVMHSGDSDLEAKEWFFNNILLSEEMILHCNEIGDSIGTVKVLQIETAVSEDDNE